MCSKREYAYIYNNQTPTKNPVMLKCTIYLGQNVKSQKLHIIILNDQIYYKLNCYNSVKEGVGIWEGGRWLHGLFGVFNI